MIHFNTAEILLIYWMAAGTYLLGYVSDKYDDYEWWGIVVGFIIAFILVPIQIVQVIGIYIKQLYKSDTSIHIRVAINVLVFGKNVWAKWSDEKIKYKIKDVEKHLVPKWQKTLIGRLNIKTFNKLKQLNKHRL
jgi:hypothetical protein